MPALATCANPRGLLVMSELPGIIELGIWVDKGDYYLTNRMTPKQTRKLIKELNRLLERKKI